MSVKTKRFFLNEECKIGDVNLLSFCRELKLFTMIEQLSLQVRQNSIMLKSLINRQVATPVPDDSLALFKLPLETEKDLEDLEKVLGDKTKQKTLVCRISLTKLLKV